MVSFFGNFDLHTVRGALAKKQGTIALRALMDRRHDGPAVLRKPKPFFASHAWIGCSGVSG